MRNGLKDFGWSLKWKLSASISLMFLFTSCVEFEGQTLMYRYDLANDRLLCFQVYENIHGKSQTDTVGPQGEIPSKEEKNQLKSVMTGQRTFFFDNWIIGFNQEEHLEEIENSKRDLAKADQSKKPAINRYIQLNEDIIGSVSVKNGGFYLNDKNQLCGYQYVTISNVSEIVSGINEVWASHLQKGLMNGDDFDEATLKQIQEAVDASEWVQIEGNQFRIRWVSEDEDTQECDADDLLCALISKVDVQYEKPFAEILVGQRNQTITELTVPPSSSVRPNLIKYVKDTYGIKESVPIEKFQDEFLRTGRIPE